MNKNYRKLLFAAAFSTLLAGAASPAFAAGTDLESQVDAATATPVSQSLQGVVVTGSSNPLLRADQRIALLNASLPLDTGNNAAQPNTYQRVAALFPESPETATGEAQRVFERTRAPVSGTYGPQMQ